MYRVTGSRLRPPSNGPSPVGTVKRPTGKRSRRWNPQAKEEVVLSVLSFKEDPYDSSDVLRYMSSLFIVIVEGGRLRTLNSSWVRT